MTAKPSRLPPWAWFVLLWLAGVAAVSLVGGVLKLFFNAVFY